MSQIVKIDDEVISTEEFVKILKLSDEYPALLKRIVKHKVTVHAAKKRGLTVSDEELQKAADVFRNYMGLHRAKETYDWMDEMGISLDDLEKFITEQCYKEKMVKTITTDEAIEEYFTLHSPKFDEVDVKHIVVDSHEKAKELMALIVEEPEGFDEFVEEHSLDVATKHKGGQIGRVHRRSLPDEVNVKIFNAAPGDVVGPFPLGENLYAVIVVNALYPARLDDSTRTKIADAIYDEWLQARFREHTVTK